MNTVMNIGVSGMRAAHTRFAAHAENIVNHNTPGYPPYRPQQISATGGPVVRLQRSDKSRPENPGEGEDTLASDLVGLMLAKYDHSASAVIIRTAGEMQGTLLDVLA